jgi:hypothetical protein
MEMMTHFSVGRSSPSLNTGNKIISLLRILSTSLLVKVKVKISLLQAMEAHRVLRG